MLRYLYFHESGVIADLEGRATFRMMPNSGPKGGVEVAVCTEGCYAQVFVGTEAAADVFLARLANQLGAAAVGGQAEGQPDDPRRPAGLAEKYLVRKADGTPTDPSACYFVLRYDTDRHARTLLYRYAGEVSHENPRLALDLLTALNATASRAGAESEPAAIVEEAAPPATPATEEA